MQADKNFTDAILTIFRYLKNGWDLRPVLDTHTAMAARTGVISLERRSARFLSSYSGFIRGEVSLSSISSYKRYDTSVEEAFYELQSCWFQNEGDFHVVMVIRTSRPRRMVGASPATVPHWGRVIFLSCLPFAPTCLQTLSRSDVSAI